MDSGLFSQYFAYKRYFNTIIGPWDLSRIVDNGRLYILTEYNVFWTGLARSGLVWTGPARVRMCQYVLFYKIFLFFVVRNFPFDFIIFFAGKILYQISRFSKKIS